MNRRRDRAQTTIDFAIGTSVFLLTVAFVVAFVPGILQPFTGGPQDELAGVDHVADTIVYDMLDGGDDTTALDTACTIAFFNDTDTDTGCRFDDTAALSEQVALEDDYSINVTVVAGRDGTTRPVCTDGTTVTVSDTDTCTSGIQLDGGDPIPQEGASIIGRRVVHVDGTTAIVVVRLW